MTSTTETRGSSAQRERRRRILDATIALADEGGFDAVQMQPQLTEALTRAFMFADASVADEIDVVGMKLTEMLAHAIDGTDSARKPTAEDTAIVRVIGDVWLSALMGWVTGRTSAADVTRSMDVAVRMLLR